MGNINRMMMRCQDCGWDCLDGCPHWPRVVSTEWNDRTKCRKSTEKKSDNQSETRFIKAWKNDRVNTASISIYQHLSTNRWWADGRKSSYHRLVYDYRCYYCRKKDKTWLEEKEKQRERERESSFDLLFHFLLWNGTTKLVVNIPADRYQRFGFLYNDWS